MTEKQKIRIKIKVLKKNGIIIPRRINYLNKVPELIHHIIYEELVSKDNLFMSGWINIVNLMTTCKKLHDIYDKIKPELIFLFRERCGLLRPPQKVWIIPEPNYLLDFHSIRPNGRKSIRFSYYCTDKQYSATKAKFNNTEMRLFYITILDPHDEKVVHEFTQIKKGRRNKKIFELN